MWDSLDGGWFVSCDSDGRPDFEAGKHTHGSIYATQACFLVGAVLGEQSAVDLAVTSFDWLDTHAWDAEQGGYWGWLRRDGMPYGVRGDAPRRCDHTGTSADQKDANVHGDMLEMLTEFPAAIATPVVIERLRWLVDWATQAAGRHGELRSFYNRQMEPAGRAVNPGYELQMVHRLPAARARFTGTPTLSDSEVILARHAMQHVRPNGAIVGVDDEQQWWLQAERLRSSAVVTESGVDVLGSPEDAWSVLVRLYVDQRRGGLRSEPARITDRGPKGTVWKDASHEAFALARALEHFAARRA